MLSKLFSPAAMALSLEGQDRDEVFRQLIALIPNLHDGARAGLLLSLLERERLGSTALGRGVALPHTRYPVAGVTRPQIIFGRHGEGIRYGALDGVPVRLLFLLVSPDVSQHLQILSRLTRILRDGECCDDFLKAATPHEVLQSIEEVEQRVHSRITGVAVRSE